LLTIDCRELTVDEQLALASEISDKLQGKTVALVRDVDIVFDTISGVPPGETGIEPLVREFVSRRKDSEHYSVETEGDTIVVHSPDPLARGRGRRMAGLPENVLKCPFCAFVTPYQEAYDVHFRSHLFGV